MRLPDHIHGPQSHSHVAMSKGTNCRSQVVNESHGKKSDESHFHVLIVSEASNPSLTASAASARVSVGLSVSVVVSVVVVVFLVVIVESES